MRNGLYKKKLEDLLAICQKNLRTVNEDLIRRAFDFSLAAHKQDLRASGEPYFNHPYEVALIVAKEIPLDDVSVAAALLHDVAEDTDYEIKDIKQEFGQTIADIVDGATKITDLFQSHEVTKAESFRKMLLSMVKDIRVMLIKFADRLHNMRTLEYLPEKKRGRIAKETLDIYAPFAHRFGLAKIKWEFEDLAFKYLQSNDYEFVSRAIKAKRRERENYIKKFITPIEKKLKEEGLIFEVAGRPKHLYSIWTKMQKREKPIDELYDLFAVRIILDTQNKNDCFAVYGIISEIYIPIPERFKNYISIPKKNGYQSIHTTVIGPEGKMVEVQIRTRAMHEIAERGIAAHWKYKEGSTELESDMDNWLTWVREMFEQTSEESTARQLIESFKLNLYQDEIYIFTPKGDLKILPKGATPVDFAFDVHSIIGFHCIGAKVNGKIVSLDYQLSSGDQVEIITSKNQTPNKDWEQFVVTQKAKSHIKKWFKDEQRKQITEGRAIWEKRLKKHKLHLNEDVLIKHIQEITSASNLADFYTGIVTLEINPDTVAYEISERIKHPLSTETKDVQKENAFEKFIESARSFTSGIKLFGSHDNYLHNFAKCCNPIPGDEIIGYVTVGEGIKIHRKNCVNIIKIIKSDPNRMVEVGWPKTDGVEFSSAIKIAGDDRPGLLNDITNVISTYQNTNIRGIDIGTRNNMFEGTIILNVKNLDHLYRLLEKIRKIKGVEHAARLEH
ncbi:MAG: bifunctional (p)ppGpp synthetase/guanosine-3',5'-bis(diphosphate) 3'-pyrophosphohydrolase [Bacteroidetes bacterium]|nr:bifunctional (p)ppGpp synthetase/guanosine-3',5'-bis(diphosphate) 3'-pyrophosphohydrolase [Bacteroidota bacterium]MBU1423693.1 bifunctional (p)ppGpp synthetase/guanosine-3',5'-bis(diphosphate) 3'-pyrophosphohydrolase [Bacteroidota bacterium]